MTTTISLRVFALAAAGMLLLRPGFGQRSGASTPPPSSGGTTPGGTPGGGRGPSTGQGNTPNTGVDRTSPNTTPTRPILITGRVMMDDGSEMPHNIAIERVCGASPRIEGHTDSKGYFSFELGSRNVDALQDASTSGLDDFGAPGMPRSPGNGVSQQQLMGCELRARLAGYQSQSVDLSTRQTFDNPDVGTILLHRIAETEGTTISATTLAAPKNARKGFQKGLDLEKKKKLDEARTSFQQAVELYPKYAEAWFELGRVQAAQGQLDAARTSFDESIRSDSKYVPPYIQISMIELSAQRWQELADVTDKASRLDPFGFPQAFFFNAVANYNLHHVEAAEQSARRAQRLDTQHRLPQVSHLLGVILASRQDYTAAAAEMRDYLKFAPEAKDATAVRSQLADLEKRASATAPPQPQP